MILKHDLPTNSKTERIFQRLPRTKRIVDVGCGIRPCPVFRCEEYICIEPHDEYVAVLREWCAPASRCIVIQDTIDALAKQPRKDTTVLLLDVIEHMEKPHGEQMRDLMAEFEHAIIFTPLGWYPQGDENPDVWGYHGGYWQKHRSEWHVDDFRGWEVDSWPKWHRKHGVGAILARR